MKRITLLIIIVFALFGFTEESDPNRSAPDLPTEIAVFTECSPEASGPYSFQLIRKEEPKHNFGIVSNSYQYSDDNGHDLVVTLNHGTGVMGKSDSTHYSMVIRFHCAD